MTVTLLVACAVAIACADAPTGGSSQRLRRLVADPKRTVRRSRDTSWTPWAAAVAAAAGAAAVLGGWLGLTAAALCLVLLPRWFARLEPGQVRRRRQRRAAQVPLLLDVLAASVAAGSAPGTALAAVAAAAPPELSTDLSQVWRTVQAGASVEAAFADSPTDLGPLAEVFERSSRTGASTADLLASASAELRARRRADRLDAARRLGVRAAAPLGLCFLPGFVLLGLVPVVFGLVQQLL